MQPTLIAGGKHQDDRGKLLYNNIFNVAVVKRIYCIENINIELKRQWQGHKVEQRWFTAVLGSFKIQLIAINNWESPDRYLNPLSFILNSDTLDVLYIPPGYVSSIQASEPHSRLLVMADYLINEIKDEFKFRQDYFINAL